MFFASSLVRDCAGRSRRERAATAVVGHNELAITATEAETQRNLFTMSHREEMRGSLVKVGRKGRLTHRVFYVWVPVADLLLVALALDPHAGEALSPNGYTGCMDGGDLIREARRRAGLTQTELAHNLATTQSVIARWESGHRSPTFATTVRALRACDLRLDTKLVPVDDGPLGVALGMAQLTPAERLEANRRLIALSGIATDARPA